MLGHQAEQQTWQSALVARHPGLFILSENGRTFTPGYPEVGDGWRELIETAVGRIAAALSGAKAQAGWVRIVEIKSKYGTLRLYWRGEGLSDAVEKAIQQAVELAEARSACSCEICGAPGVLHARGDWLATACAVHANGTTVPTEPGWENLHLVRGYHDGKVAIILCRRYVRETDSFDVGIEAHRALLNVLLAAQRRATESSSSAFVMTDAICR
jgi:hypothetical protein